jgi:hypothetical protein
MYANGAGMSEHDKIDWKGKPTSVQGWNSFKDPQLRLNSEDGIKGCWGVLMDCIEPRTRSISI